MPFHIQVGEQPAQAVTYLDRRELETDSDGVLVDVLRQVADEIERMTTEERDK
ncbi:MAG: hypothetical protein ABIQ18_21615 [Umezawaea sp.]